MGAGSRVTHYEFGSPVWERLDNQSWQSPFHIRGVKSSSIFGGHIRRKLTDAAIDRYAERGYYGLEEMWARKK